MAPATNPRDIFFEHEVAIQEEAAERAAEIESDRDVDWEALNNVADAMTSMVYKNINEKFQKSFFGQFIKPHFFEETSASKSIFEQGVYAYAFCVITYLTMKDIDFTVPNNPFSKMAKEFSDYNDLDQFFFILECKTVNSDLTRFESYEIRAEISRSSMTDINSELRDVATITQLHNAINKDSYPYYCDTMRKKVIYSIFEYDTIRMSNDIDMEYVVNNYAATQCLLNDFQLVNEMEII
jgi:hypothetical protein